MNSASREAQAGSEGLFGSPSLGSLRQLPQRPAERRQRPAAGTPTESQDCSRKFLSAPRVALPTARASGSPRTSASRNLLAFELPFQMPRDPARGIAMRTRSDVAEAAASRSEPRKPRDLSESHLSAPRVALPTAWTPCFDITRSWNNDMAEEQQQPGTLGSQGPLRAAQAVAGQGSTPILGFGAIGSVAAPRPWRIASADDKLAPDSGLPCLRPALSGKRDTATGARAG